jgi:hypothetical protein
LLACFKIKYNDLLDKSNLYEIKWN